LVNNFEIWKKSATFEIATSEGWFSLIHGIVHAGFRGFRLLIPHYTIPLTVGIYCKKPTAKIVHLVFAETQANAEKPKELFFANARIE